MYMLSYWLLQFVIISDPNVFVYRSECEDPVAILKEYQENLMRGRALDIQDENILIEGKTSEIFISRSSLFSDAIDELMNGGMDVSLPLEVTFNGEMAEDYGGPRKEFLGIAIRETMECLFEDDGFGQYIIKDDVSYIRRNHYFVGGLIFGKTAILYTVHILIITCIHICIYFRLQPFTRRAIAKFYSGKSAETLS